MSSASRTFRQLDRLAGHWKTTGVMLGGPDKGKAFSGSDRYRWLPGNRFLQHTWNVRMPDGLHRGIEIFGLDAQGTLFAHAYDADGTFTASRITFRGGVLQMAGARLSFRGRIDRTGNSISGTWSTTDGAEPVMKVSLRRAGSTGIAAI